MPEGQQIRVKGHTLRYEGRVSGFYGMRSGKGQAICSCGWQSGTLDTTAARQRAHRRHKAEVLAEAKK